MSGNLIKVDFAQWRTIRLDGFFKTIAEIGRGGAIKGEYELFKCDGCGRSMFFEIGEYTEFVKEHEGLRCPYCVIAAVEDFYEQD